MSLKSAVLVLSQAFAGVTSLQYEEPKHVELLIAGITVISPERETPMADAFVAIDGGRIVSIDLSDTGLTADSRINGDGLYLIPGLIDGHVHLQHATGLKRRHAHDFDGLRAAFQKQQPRSYLYHGYTTLVDLNSDARQRRVFESAPLHPDVIHCGQAVVVSDDFMATDYATHEEFLAAYPGFLHDRFGKTPFPDGYDLEAHAPPAVVAHVAMMGGKCVKLHYEEALWWPDPKRPDFSLPSVEIVRELVEEAHRQGMPVLLHATTPAGYRFALETGVDLVVHGLWEWDTDGKPDAAAPRSMVELASSVAASIGIQPTVQTLRNTLSMFDSSILEDSAWRHVVPPEYLHYLRSDAQAQREEYMSWMGPTFARYGVQDGGIADAIAGYVQRYEDLLSRLPKDGLRWSFGTDTAVGGAGWGNPPGLNGYWEMQLWVHAGIGLDVLLRAATLDNAMTFGMDGDIGSIEVGKRANLLVLKENPLETIRAYDSIVMVIHDGLPIERSALSADRSREP